MLSPACLPTSCCSSVSEFDLPRPGLCQRLTLPGLDWAGCRLFLFSWRKGHCVTVKLLSGGSSRGISHVGSVESFVFSLNKKRKRKHLWDPHLPRGVQGWASCLGWRRCELLGSPALGPAGMGSPSLGMLVLVRENEHSWRRGFFGSWGYFHKSVTPGLKENSTLGQPDSSVLGHPPQLLSAVLNLSGFALRLAGFQSSSVEHHWATVDGLLHVSSPQFSHLYNGTYGGILRIKYGGTYKNA